MKLVNMITWKGFPMRKVGPYAVLAGELAFDHEAVKESVEWTVQVGDVDAVLLGEAVAGVIEASDQDREALSKATLSVRIDGEPVVDQIPLLGSSQRKPQPQAFRSFMFLGVEDDEPRGIFLSNGTIVEAVIRTPKKVRKASKVRVMVGADLYRSV